MESLSRVWLFATPQTVAYQAPPSIGFSRQEYWSRLPFPSPVRRVQKPIKAALISTADVCEQPVLSSQALVLALGSSQWIYLLLSRSSSYPPPTPGVKGWMQVAEHTQEWKGQRTSFFLSPYYIPLPSPGAIRRHSLEERVWFISWEGLTGMLRKRQMFSCTSSFIQQVAMSKWQNSKEKHWEPKPEGHWIRIFKIRN